MVADTLVRYLYRGAEGSLAEAALAHFNELATNWFCALRMVLDRHTEEVRLRYCSRDPSSSPDTLRAGNCPEQDSLPYSQDLENVESEPNQTETL
jgi:hypothetical protein